MQEHQELKPKDVAKILNASYRKAKRLMESGEIKSWIDTTAEDGRKYLKTILPEIEKYHYRKLNQHSNARSKTSHIKISKACSIDDLFKQIGV